MRAAAIAITLSLATGPALAAEATWTGRKEQVQLPAGSSYGWIWRCEYELDGTKFWRTFETSACPATVEVKT